MLLRDAIKCVSYSATLVIMTTPKGPRDYKYMFSATELITRGVIEKCYPELLTKELSDGFHGEGLRDGLYIHLFE